MENKFKCRRSLCDKSFTLKNNRIRHEHNCKKGEVPERYQLSLYAKMNGVEKNSLQNLTLKGI